MPHLKIPSDEVAAYALRNIDCRDCGAGRGTDCRSPDGTCECRRIAAHMALKDVARRAKRDLAERENPRTLMRPDGSVVTARMTRADGRALTRLMTCLAIAQPPKPADVTRVMRLWDESILTADEMDEVWWRLTMPDRPFTDHDGMPQWDVILSGFETSRARH